MKSIANERNEVNKSSSLLQNNIHDKDEPGQISFNSPNLINEYQKINHSLLFADTPENVDSLQIFINNSSSKIEQIHLDENKPSEKEEQIHLDENKPSEKEEQIHSDENKPSEKEELIHLDENKPSEKDTDLDADNESHKIYSSLKDYSKPFSKGHTDSINNRYFSTEHKTFSRQSEEWNKNQTGSEFTKCNLANDTPKDIIGSSQNTDGISSIISSSEKDHVLPNIPMPASKIVSRAKFKESNSGKLTINIHNPASSNSSDDVTSNVAVIASHHPLNKIKDSAKKKKIISKNENKSDSKGQRNAKKSSTEQAADSTKKKEIISKKENKSESKGQRNARKSSTEQAADSTFHDAQSHETTRTKNLSHDACTGKKNYSKKTGKKFISALLNKELSDATNHVASANMSDTEIHDTDDVKRILKSKFGLINSSINRDMEEKHTKDSIHDDSDFQYLAKKPAFLYDEEQYKLISEEAEERVLSVSIVDIFGNKPGCKKHHIDEIDRFYVDKVINLPISMAAKEGCQPSDVSEDSAKEIDNLEKLMKGRYKDGSFQTFSNKEIDNSEFMTHENDNLISYAEVKGEKDNERKTALCSKSNKGVNQKRSTKNRMSYKNVPSFSKEESKSDLKDKITTKERKTVGACDELNSVTDGTGDIKSLEMDSDSFTKSINLKDKFLSYSKESNFLGNKFKTPCSFRATQQESSDNNNPEYEFQNCNKEVDSESHNILDKQAECSKISICSLDNSSKKSSSLVTSVRRRRNQRKDATKEMDTYKNKLPASKRGRKSVKANSKLNNVVSGDILHATNSRDDNFKTKTKRINFNKNKSKISQSPVETQKESLYKSINKSNKAKELVADKVRRSTRIESQLTSQKTAKNNLKKTQFDSNSEIKNNVINNVENTVDTRSLISETESDLASHLSVSNTATESVNNSSSPRAKKHPKTVAYFLNSFVADSESTAISYDSLSSKNKPLIKKLCHHKSKCNCIANNKSLFINEIENIPLDTIHENICKPSSNRKIQEGSLDNKPNVDLPVDSSELSRVKTKPVNKRKRSYENVKQHSDEMDLLTNKRRRCLKSATNLTQSVNFPESCDIKISDKNQKQYISNIDVTNHEPEISHSVTDLSEKCSPKKKRKRTASLNKNLSQLTPVENSMSQLKTDGELKPVELRRKRSVNAISGVQHLKENAEVSNKQEIEISKNTSSEISSSQLASTPLHSSNLLKCKKDKDIESILNLHSVNSSTIRRSTRIASLRKTLFSGSTEDYSSSDKFSSLTFNYNKSVSGSKSTRNSNSLKLGLNYNLPVASMVENKTTEKKRKCAPSEMHSSQLSVSEVEANNIGITKELKNAMEGEEQISNRLNSALLSVSGIEKSELNIAEKLKNAQKVKKQIVKALQSSHQSSQKVERNKVELKATELKHSERKVRNSVHKKEKQIFNKVPSSQQSVSGIETNEQLMTKELKNSEKKENQSLSILSSPQSSISDIAINKLDTTKEPNAAKEENQTCSGILPNQSSSFGIGTNEPTMINNAIQSNTALLLNDCLSHDNSNPHVNSSLKPNILEDVTLFYPEINSNLNEFFSSPKGPFQVQYSNGQFYIFPYTSPSPQVVYRQPTVTFPNYFPSYILQVPNMQTNSLFQPSFPQPTNTVLQPSILQSSNSVLQPSILQPTSSLLQSSVLQPTNSVLQTSILQPNNSILQPTINSSNIGYIPMTGLHQSGIHVNSNKSVNNINVPVINYIPTTGTCHSVTSANLNRLPGNDNAVSVNLNRSINNNIVVPATNHISVAGVFSPVTSAESNVTIKNGDAITLNSNISMNNNNNNSTAHFTRYTPITLICQPVTSDTNRSVKEDNVVTANSNISLNNSSVSTTNYTPVTQIQSSVTSANSNISINNANAVTVNSNVCSDNSTAVPATKFTPASTICQPINSADLNKSVKNNNVITANSNGSLNDSGVLSTKLIPITEIRSSVSSVKSNKSTKKVKAVINKSNRSSDNNNTVLAANCIPVAGIYQPVISANAKTTTIGGVAKAAVPANAKTTTTAGATETATSSNTKTAAPANTKTTTPANAKTATPANTKTAAHANTKTTTSANAETAAPANAKSATHVNPKTAAPANTKTAAPANAKTAAPANAKSAIPVNAKSATHVNAKSATPANAKSATLANTKTATPTDVKTATSTDAKTATPTDAKTATPANIKSAISADAKTATPANIKSISADAKTATPANIKSAISTDAKTAIPADAKTATPINAKTATPANTKTVISPAKNDNVLVAKHISRTNLHKSNSCINSAQSMKNCNVAPINSDNSVNDDRAVPTNSGTSTNNNDALSNSSVPKVMNMQGAYVVTKRQRKKVVYFECKEDNNEQSAEKFKKGKQIYEKYIGSMWSALKDRDISDLKDTNHSYLKEHPNIKEISIEEFFNNSLLSDILKKSLNYLRFPDIDNCAKAEYVFDDSFFKSPFIEALKEYVSFYLSNLPMNCDFKEQFIQCCYDRFPLRDAVFISSAFPQDKDYFTPPELICYISIAAVRVIFAECIKRKIL